ncbi:MAG TPA: hypothetical protein VF175_08530 [Lacipirellula sp.]
MVAAAAPLGCGPGSKTSGDGEISHIQLLASLYNKAARDLGRYPKNEQELKQTIGKMGLNLEAMKLASVDELYVSERDGQPLVIVLPPNSKGVIAYEKTGVDGTRLVAFSEGNVQEVDEVQMRDLVPK